MITKEDLLKRLENSRISLGKNPDRMLKYFITLKLIDKPVRFGLGKGKGIVSKFDDKVFSDIKSIVKLRKEGFTYEQIKHRKLGLDDILSLIGQIKTFSKSKEEVLSHIKKIPFMSDEERGEWKLLSDILEHITEIILDDLSFYFGPVITEKFKERFFKYIHDSILMDPISELITDLDVTDDDHKNYLHGEMDWKTLLPSKWHSVKKGQKNLKPAKGGKHDNHDKK